ncbi:MAG: hypothetical protein HGA97_04145 [Chlorobiaceae bacterium]|nr:hypothetical protein [Chlorobiaceae bacterium]
MKKAGTPCTSLEPGTSGVWRNRMIGQESFRLAREHPRLQPFLSLLSPVTVAVSLPPY